MKILVVGGGGREHALCWKLKQSPRNPKLYCAPGNGGIGQIAKLVPISVTEIEELKLFALKEGIDLTIVGPEQPLALGIVDTFQAAGLWIFGPDKLAAEIESSKSYAKDLMAKYQIPTAEFKTFTDEESALAYIQKQGAPIVVKANGLAAGKGVVVVTQSHQLVQAIDAVKQEFSTKNGKILVEEYLEGEELSLMAFVNGRTIVPLQVAQDHKRLLEQDQGPNTGGMGAYSPVPQFDATIIEEAVEKVLKPTANALVKEGRSFTGILYAGLMICQGQTKVIEFNARFGDPETQVVLPRMESDLLEIILACVNDDLDSIKEIKWNQQALIAVVLASQGYPEKYVGDVQIKGLDLLSNEEAIVFHSGTQVEENKTLTSGGRVLAVTAWGNDLGEASSRAYEAVSKIQFEGMQYRQDIAARAYKGLNTVTKLG